MAAEISCVQLSSALFFPTHEFGCNRQSSCAFKRWANRPDVSMAAPPIERLSMLRRLAFASLLLLVSTVFAIDAPPPLEFPAPKVMPPGSDFPITDYGAI